MGKKKILVMVLFICAFNLKAQNRYLDNLFVPKNTITRTYSHKDGEDLKLDIYEPAKDTLSKRPMIIFMHGGGFAVGSRKNEEKVKFSKMAAKKGYVAVLISYRLTRKDKSFGCDYEASGKIETFRKAAEDFLDATNYMIKNSHEFKIDTSKIIIGGSSAGAEAILQAAYNRNLLFPNGKYRDMKFAG
ncbi:MAG: alpha/beta hydrolase, partial [Gillisia sp.]